MKKEVIQIILNVCIELNEQLRNKIEISKGEDAALFGNDGVLDSLGLINLVVSTESEIERKYGKNLTLIDGNPISQENSHFSTVSTFASYLTDLLTKQTV